MKYISSLIYSLLFNVILIIPQEIYKEQTQEQIDKDRIEKEKRAKHKKDDDLVYFKYHDCIKILYR